MWPEISDTSSAIKMTTWKNRAFPLPGFKISVPKIELSSHLSIWGPGSLHILLRYIFLRDFIHKLGYYRLLMQKVENSMSREDRLEAMQNEKPRRLPNSGDIETLNSRTSRIQQRAVFRKSSVLQWWTLSVLTWFAELYYAELFKMPQAGLNLLYQDMSKLTTKPQKPHVLGGDSQFFLTSGYIRCKSQNRHPLGADLTNQSTATPAQITTHPGLAFQKSSPSPLLKTEEL